MTEMRLKTTFLFSGWLLLGALLLIYGVAAQTLQKNNWQKLPALPVALAGQFVGVSGGKLLVINGTNWTDGIWESRQKTWRNSIYALDSTRSNWREIGQMPVAVAYGASITTPDGIICLGGQTKDAFSNQVFRVKFTKEKLIISNLPDLPIALAFFGAAIIDDKIYVAGGQTSLTATNAQRDFYALDLKNTKSGWQKLEPIPGAGRILPVVIAQDKSVYVISGAEITTANDGISLKRLYLTDAYRYHPKTGWKQINDIPHSTVGAAATAKNSRIFIFGGDSGSDFAQTETLKDAHPGFALDVLSFDAKKNIWSPDGDYPLGLVTTTAVRWQKKLVIAGGEDRPRSRSAQVTALGLENIK